MQKLRDDEGSTCGPHGKRGLSADDAAGRVGRLVRVKTRGTITSYSTYTFANNVLDKDPTCVAISSNESCSIVVEDR